MPSISVFFGIIIRMFYNDHEPPHFHAEHQGLQMTMLPGVVRAEYRDEYRIHLAFNDGTSKTVDFQPWLEGPIFEPLRDQRYFRQFFVAGSTICWPNGADIAPETLYAATDIRRVA